MRTSVFHLNDQNENLYYFINDGLKSGEQPSKKRAEMLSILHKAVQGSLTDLQRECLLRYYEGTRQRQIAADLGISPSTVSRHISTAKRKLQKIAGYYT